LTGNLTTENSYAILFGRNTTEDIDFDDFEVEERDEVVKGGGHDPIVGSKHATSAE
jgi:hypothetical protein